MGLPGRGPVFTGAVMSKRKHKPTKAEKDEKRDKEEADSFPMGAVQVFAKKPEGRLKWLHKALIHIGKGSVKATAVYNMVTHPKFLPGVGAYTTKQMSSMLLGNLHLFSQKQKRFLQSESCKFSPSALKNQKDAHDGTSGEYPDASKHSRKRARERRRRPRSDSGSESSTRSRRSGGSSSFVDSDDFRQSSDSERDHSRRCMHRQDSSDTCRSSTECNDRVDRRGRAERNGRAQASKGVADSRIFAPGVADAFLAEGGGPGNHRRRAL